MFIKAFQAGNYFEFFDPKEAQSTNKDIVQKYYKLYRVTIPSQRKIVFDKVWQEISQFISGFQIDLQGFGNKLIMPKTGDLGLIQQFLVLQVSISPFHHWTLELDVTDITKTKRRIVLTSSVKQLEKHHFHIKSPIDLIRREQWLNLCIDIWSFMEAFQGNGCTFRSLDGITIGAPCKIRKIFLMKNPIEDSEVEIPFPQGFMQVPKQVNFPEGFPYSNQIVTFRLLNFNQFQLSHQIQNIPDDPQEVYQPQQFLKYEQKDTKQKVSSEESDLKDDSQYFSDIEDQVMDLIYDPKRKCYIDPKTNEMYKTDSLTIMFRVNIQKLTCVGLLKYQQECKQNQQFQFMVFKKISNSLLVKFHKIHHYVKTINKC
ncbi:hypothetical protein pb186bvf_015015 [Paramecium bursaria]